MMAVFPLVVQYMHDRGFTERTSVLQLARVIGISRPYLTRAFKQEVGVTPAQYLRNARLRLAKDMLESSNLSVKEVAAAVGGGDVSHFSRDFKRLFGAAPTVLRKIRRRKGMRRQDSLSNAGVGGPGVRPDLRFHRLSLTGRSPRR
jgi:transcriptional regulator GlxA family with amidase domain